MRRQWNRNPHRAFRKGHSKICPLLAYGPPNSDSEPQSLAQGSDVVVLDCNFEKRLSEYHLGTMGVGKLVDKIEPKMTYLSHVSHRNLPHEELEDFFIKSRANIMPGYDGLRVQI